MQVLLDPRFEWRTQARDGLTLHWRGDAGAATAAAAALAALPAREIAPVAAVLAAADGHFALIVECPDAIVAAVDHCRSVPVFAVTDGARACVSNDARAARDHAALTAPDPDSVLEAAMAGYVTGPHTLFRGLSQLEAGEVLVWRRGDAATHRRRYFAYWPDRFADADEATLAARLAAVTDRAIARVIAGADGAPVWVALSAGLDSRLILAKLVEQGCPNLVAFTYGPRGTDEARAAAHIARRLNVD